MTTKQTRAFVNLLALIAALIFGHGFTIGLVIAGIGIASTTALPFNAVLTTAPFLFFASTIIFYGLIRVTRMIEVAEAEPNEES